MNTVKMIDLVKEVLENNKNTLVEGLFHQGQQREIKVITSSTLTPPTEFYWILVTCSDSRENDYIRPTNIGVNVRGVQRISYYDIQVTVGDEALITVGEENAFETMDRDFQKFMNRISQLIMEKDEELVFRLDDDRVITQSNESEYWDVAEGYHAMLYSQLRFTLYELNKENELY